MRIAKHVGFEIELRVVWREMKDADHRAKSYCNKTMSSSSACEGPCSIKRQLKQSREGEKNAGMKQREGKGGKRLGLLQSDCLARRQCISRIVLGAGLFAKKRYKSSTWFILIKKSERSD